MNVSCGTIDEQFLFFFMLEHSTSNYFCNKRNSTRFSQIILYKAFSEHVGNVMGFFLRYNVNMTVDLRIKIGIHCEH